MPDEAHIETDKIIKKIERRLFLEYHRANHDMEIKLADYFKEFESEDKAKRALLKEGEITEKAYNQWRVEQVMIGKRWEEMLDTLAKDYHNTNEIARQIAKDNAYDVYALNHDFGTFQVEKESLVDTSYTLYDRATVSRLAKENQKMLPDPSERTLKRIRDAKEKRWSKQKMTSAIMQGILQGEPLAKVAKRLRTVTNMEEAQAMRNARTMMTNAQSAGRYDAYRRAKGMGIYFKVIWIATLDNRTRHEHRLLDGQMQEVDTPFEVEGNQIMYPADLGGGSYKVPPELIYNCRCTIGAAIPGTKLYEQGIEGMERFSRLEGMSYEEWKGEHQKQAEESSGHAIVQGQDISTTWERRPNKFDFEIDDVINAQGFDGLPRVVSAEEFDDAVKAANGGNGFIAQRSYTAPDQETLDAYRKQLYEGKWYVDCSTGGAQYGQGMYCAASYDGQLNNKIITEMEYYSKFNQEKLSRNFSGMDKDEQKELLPSVLKEVAPELTSAQHRDFIDFFTYDRLGGAWDGSISFERAKEARTALRKSGINIGKIGVDIDEYRTSALSYVETMTLDPSAKIITYKELDSMRSYGNIQKKLIEEMDIGSDQKSILKKVLVEDKEDSSAIENETIKKLGKRIEKRANQLMEMDPGSFAATLGYDAINAEGHGQSGSYTVVLNRTKLIIREP